MWYFQKILLKTMLRHTENKVICDSLHGFSKAKSSVTKMMTLSDGNKVLVDEGRATGIIYLELCKANHCSTWHPVCKLERQGFERYAILWIRNWLCSHSHWLAVNVSMSRWDPVMNGVLRERHWPHRLSASLLATGTVVLSESSASLPVSPSSWHTGGKGWWHPEGPWQAWEVLPCKAHEVQRGEMQKASLIYPIILGERGRGIFTLCVMLQG